MVYKIVKKTKTIIRHCLVNVILQIYIPLMVVGMRLLMNV